MKEILISISMFCVMFLMGFALGGATTERKMERSAIEAGVGRYLIKDKTKPFTEFQWVTNQVYK